MNLKQWCDSHWFKLKESIDFDIDRYWDGNISITTVLKIIEDPIFDYVMTNHKEAVEKAAEQWTHEHYKADKFFDKWSWVTDMNLNFTKFLTLYDVKIIHREKIFYKEYKWFKFRWSVDLLWEVNYPFTSHKNIDYKNSTKHSPKYLMQLEWYHWLNSFLWLLVYGKWKLKVIEYNWELESIWLELLDYFISLLKK